VRCLLLAVVVLCGPRVVVACGQPMDSDQIRSVLLNEYVFVGQVIDVKKLSLRSWQAKIRVIENIKGKVGKKEVVVRYPWPDGTMCLPASPPKKGQKLIWKLKKRYAASPWFRVVDGYAAPFDDRHNVDWILKNERFRWTRYGALSVMLFSDTYLSRSRIPLTNSSRKFIVFLKNDSAKSITLKLASLVAPRPFYIRLEFRHKTGIFQPRLCTRAWRKYKKLVRQKKVKRVSTITLLPWTWKAFRLWTVFEPAIVVADGPRNLGFRYYPIFRRLGVYNLRAILENVWVNGERKRLTTHPISISVYDDRKKKTSRQSR